MAKNTGQKTKAPNGTADPAPESIDQVRDILFGGQMRMVDARLQGLEERVLQETAALRADFERQITDLDGSIKKELARHAERLASERTKRAEDLKAVSAELKEALKGLERRHQTLEEVAGIADAELRDHMLKQGAAFGYTKLLGYHPLLATRADTGEVLHVRLRKGSAASCKGVLRFVDELIARVQRAGATGTKLLRADNAFWNNKLMARLEKAGWQYSIGVRMQAWVPDAIAQIAEDDWQPLADYPDDGEAQIAETAAPGGRRLVVRRTRLVGAQAELWPDWRHFAFITNRTEPLETVEADHRQHAVVELAIRDLKDQALAHFPSGQFNANSAWTVLAALAHNAAALRWRRRCRGEGRQRRLGEARALLHPGARR
jgi:hypothetical protein